MRTARAREKKRPMPHHSTHPLGHGGFHVHSKKQSLGSRKHSNNLAAMRRHSKTARDKAERDLRPVSYLTNDRLAAGHAGDAHAGDRHHNKALPLDRVSVYLANENGKNSIKSFLAGLTLSRR